MQKQKANYSKRFFLFLIVFFAASIQVALHAQNAIESAPSDTVTRTICPDALPYTYEGQTFETAGSYIVSHVSELQRDTVHTLLQLSTYSEQHDTIRLDICSNDFPYRYSENILFMGATNYSTRTFATDTNGCAVSTTFIVNEHPVYSVERDIHICDVDTPFSFAGHTFSANGTYEIPLTSVLGCDSIIRLKLTVHPSLNLRDTLSPIVCSHELPYQIGDSSFTQEGTYDFSLQSKYGCDSVNIHLVLTVLQTQMDTLFYTVCSNEFPFEVNPYMIFDSAGTYTLVSDGANYCPNITTVIIEEKTAYEDTLTVNICDIDLPYVYGDTTFTESTIYTISNTTTLGCDSNFTFVLNVSPTYDLVDTSELSLCSIQIPYEYAGTTIDSAGVYDFEIKTAAGCDSVRQHLTVQIFENPKDTVTLHICANSFPYSYQDTLIDTAGVYDIFVPDTVHFGCDTLRHLVINEMPIYHDSITVNICSNIAYEVGDTVLTEPGIYDILLQTEAGCDSLVTITLSHYPTYMGDTLSFTVCENTLPFQYEDTLFNTEGLHLVNLTSVNGCDSIIPIDLHILPILYNTDTLSREICASELPITAFGRTLTQAGTYTYIVPSVVTGCDSVFYFNLIVHENPSPAIMGSPYLCDGSVGNLSVEPATVSYLWNTGATSQIASISLPGNYSVTVTNEYGCSGSASKLVQGAALPNITITGTQTVCAGQSSTLTIEGASSYVWEDGRTTSTIEVYPLETTIYHVTATNETNCSREGSFTVRVNPLPQPIITGTDTVCVGDYTDFVVVGGQTYLWSTGITGDRISVHSPGIYTVTVTDENGCRNTSSKQLTVNNRPNIRINGRTKFCLGGSTVITAGGASSYEWSSGESTASVSTTFAGTYTVTGTAANGCSATATVELTTSQVTATINGERHFCQGGNTTLTVAGNETYHYRWGDGTTTESIEVSSPGQYSVTVTNMDGCTNTITANVSEYALPTPSISGVLTICEGRSTILRAVGGISYLWDDGSTNAYISVNTTGTYTVTATNAYGCSSSISETVIVNPKPEITILTNNSICNGESVSLYAASAAGNSFAWTSGQTSPLINVSPSSTTTYTVLVTDENNCSNSASETIVVNPLPVPYISGELSFCQGGRTILTASGGASYQWSNNATGNVLAVSAGGTYTVTATNVQGCSASTNVTVTANSLPVVMITDNTSICQGQTATLTASATSNCTYTWSTGSYENSIHVSATGNYTVTVTNANGCFVNRSVNVTVHNNPQITLMGTTTLCEGQSTQIAAYANENATFTWSNGTNNSVATFFETGIYTVTATNNYGCSNTASSSITVHPRPVPTISGELTICPNGSTVLTASNGSSYRWSTGSTQSSIYVSPTSPTSYSVTVTDAYGCQGSTSSLVTIGSTPTVNISGERQICAGQSTQLNATAGFASYAWSTNTNTPSIITSTAGVYKVTVTNALGCEASDSITVEVNELPQLNFGMQHSICAGQSHTYTLPQDPNLTYAWSNNAVGNEITVYNAGIYTVTATNQYGCSRSASDSLNVHPIPTPSITGSTSICRGSSTVLTAQGGNSYAWSNGATTSDIAVFPVTQTTYTVTAYNNFGCSASTSATVSVKVLPSVNFTGNRNFCPGESTSITANGGTTYLWSTGASTSSINIQNPGTYFVTVTNSVGCQRSDSVVIGVYDQPSVSISGQSPLCLGSTSTLTASGCYTYSWSTSETGPSIVIRPQETTTYTVTGTDVNGCRATATKTVVVEELPNVQIAGILEICQGDTTTLTATGGTAYIWSNGNTTNSIRVSDAGNYTVVATNEHGCSASKTETLTVYTRPVTHINGANTLCSNQTAELTATGGDYYRWSTGSTSDRINISVGGYYSVTATNTHNCSSSANISVATLSAPFVQIVGAGNICNGSSTTLFASSNAQNYSWNIGESTSSITVAPNTTTDYIVTVSSNNGCTSTDTMRLVVNPVYQINVTGTICQGLPYTQNGFNLPAQTEAGTFTYTNNLQTIHGCDSIINLLLTVKPLPVMPDTITGNPRIGNYGSYLYSVSGAANVNSYEWRVTNTHWTLTDNHINSAFLQISQNGSGTLIARGINECGYDEVSLSIYCNVSVEDYTNDSQILVYPNPVANYLTINFNDAVRPVAKVQMYDNLGRCLMTQSVMETQMQVDCGQYAAGTYFVRFVDADNHVIDTRKITIRK